MNLHVFIFLTFCLTTAFLQATALDPQIDDINKTVARAWLGRRAILSCNLSYAGYPSFMWKRIQSDAPPPIAIGALMYSSDSRINVEVREYSDGAFKYILIINNTTMDDAGLYECTVNSMSHQVSLNIIDIKLSGPATVEETEDIDLVCSVAGFYFPDIEWFHGGSVVQNNSHTYITESTLTTNGFETIESVLKVTDASPDDTGMYACRVADYYIKTTTVQVFRRPKTTTTTAPVTTSRPIFPDIVLTTPASELEEVEYKYLDAIQYEYYRQRIQTDRQLQRVLDLQETYYQILIEQLPKED